MSMQIIDMDSHLREEYILDEAYRLEGKFASETPIRLNDEKNVRAKFKHNFHAWPEEVVAQFRHPIFYDPCENWRGGAVAKRQLAGYDMDVRLADNEREGIDHQFLFPTQLSIPTYTEGELGSAACRLTIIGSKAWWRARKSSYGLSASCLGGIRRRWSTSCAVVSACTTSKRFI